MYEKLVINGTAYYLVPELEQKQEVFVCELDGVRWYLGPEAPHAMSWHEARVWTECLGSGYQLPPREVALVAYRKEHICKLFEGNLFWTSDQFTINQSWAQRFCFGAQYYYPIAHKLKVRAFRRQVNV